MDGDNGVAAIVLAAEHLLRLAGLDLRLVRVEAADEIGLDVLALLEPLDQHGQVVGPLAEAVAQRQVVFEPAPPLQDLLRLDLILPEIRGGET
jgi:hypothetical protein